VWLAACAPASLAATSISIALSLSLSRETAVRVDASLVPAGAHLRPGEEVTLQLEVKNKESNTLPLSFVASVRGPSNELAIQVQSSVNAPRGTTRVPVKVIARPGIVPGRYDVDIAVQAAG
jgi:uncharacterized membrane protein